MSDFKVVQLVNPIQLNLTGPSFTGAYSGATAYTTGQSVSYNGSSYVALASTTGNLPTNTAYWQLLASKGDTGSAGLDTNIVSPTNNQALVYDSASTKWVNHTLVKGDVGLSNVDNTSDVNKPVSTAQATAIGLKVDKAGDTMTGPLRIIFNESGAGPTTSHIVFGDAGLGTNASLSMNNNGQGVQIFGGSTPTTGGGIYTYGNSSGDSPGSVQFTLGNSSAEFGLYDHTQSINLIRSDDSGNFTALASVTAPTINVSSATASKVAIVDSSKNVTSSSVSTTTLGYLDATSSVQDQLNTKIDNTQSIVNALIFG